MADAGGWRRNTDGDPRKIVVTGWSGRRCAGRELVDHQNINVPAGAGTAKVMVQVTASFPEEIEGGTEMLRV